MIACLLAAALHRKARIEARCNAVIAAAACGAIGLTAVAQSVVPGRAEIVRAGEIKAGQWNRVALMQNLQ
ncbi:MAG: hypothetical protein RSA17_01345 [Ruthenibacterium sp.]